MNFWQRKNKLWYNNSDIYFYVLVLTVKCFFFRKNGDFWNVVCISLRTIFHQEPKSVIAWFFSNANWQWKWSTSFVRCSGYVDTKVQYVYLHRVGLSKHKYWACSIIKNYNDVGGRNWNNLFFALISNYWK